MSTRRRFLTHTAALAAATTLGKLADSAPRPAPATRPDRPNILWISCEDMSPDMGCYGDVYATTPNLDKLAAEGCRYTRAFTTFPVCAPSRSSIITGVHPGTLGSHQMRTGTKGYEAVPPPEVRCFTEYLRAAGYYCSNHTKTDYQFAPPFTAWDAAKGDWRNADRAPGQPFFSVINLTTTHESQCWNIATVRHDPSKAPLPPFYPDTPDVRRGIARYYDQVEQMDRQAGEILQKLKEDGLADNTVVFFWGDHGRGLPRFKRWPHDSGLRVPLVVRWPGHIKGGSICEELVCFTDLAPTLLSIAGLAIPPCMQGRALLGKQAAPEPAYVFGGRNRMDATSDDFIRTCRDRRYRYIRNFSPKVPYAQEIPYMEKSPVLKEWRRLHAQDKLAGPQKLFFRPTKPDEELYDTDNDPWEVNDLASSPQHQLILQRMRAALDKWMTDINDLGVVPEDQLIERFWPNRQQPVTAAPAGRIERADGKDIAQLSCATPGASIGYRLANRARWEIYTSPFAVGAGATVHAKAVRLGYKASEEVQIKAS